MCAYIHSMVERRSVVCMYVCMYVHLVGSLFVCVCMGNRVFHLLYVCMYVYLVGNLFVCVHR